MKCSSVWTLIASATLSLAINTSAVGVEISFRLETEFEGREFLLYCSEARVVNGLYYGAGKGQLVISDLPAYLTNRNGRVATDLIDKQLPPTLTRASLTHLEAQGDSASSTGVLLVEASKEDALLEVFDAINNPTPLIFAPDALLTFNGVIKFGDYEFHSDEEDPLVLKISDSVRGYKYISGRGSVIKKGVKEEFQGEPTAGVSTDEDVVSQTRTPKTCEEIIKEWTTSDLDIIAKAWGMSRATLQAIGVKGPQVIAPPGCSLLVEGTKVRPYCNGKPLTEDSCDAP